MDPLAITGAQTVHPNNDVKSVPEVIYSEEAKHYINFRRQRLIAARDARDTTHQEFDDMTFLQWYDKMKKADDQYVAPRKNPQDTSINAGTIRDKDTTLVEYATKYDFEPIAQVFDDSDDMLEELAETAEDLVRKSKLLESYKDKAKLIYRSMVTFGTAMVEDLYIEKWVIQKTLKNGYKVGIGSQKAEWEQRLVKAYDGCQSKLWDLRKCYFGDMRKFFMNGVQGQPYFFTVEYESYDVTKQLFGNWDRWINVPNTIVLTQEISSATVYSHAWTLRPITMNFCEIIRYYDPVANEFAITINGVDMLPIMEKKEVAMVDGVEKEKVFVSGFPLTEVSPSGAINFAKYDLEPMHDFVYSKGQPAKMRVWGDVENMIVKLFLRMFKQRTDPTMGNKSGRVFGAEVTDPGTVINDIREGDLFPVLPQTSTMGVTSGDFSFYSMISKQLSKNSVEDQFQGIDPTATSKTAEQYMSEMKAQSLKVAALFDGIISGENQLNWLRTYNIIKNWTKPVDKQIDITRKQIVDVYRTVTMPTSIDGGQKAIKKIVFTKSTPKGKPSLEDSQALHQEEMDYGKEKGGAEIRIVQVNPEVLASMKLSWFYNCVPVPNGSDPLAYMMFAKQITDATAMFGADSLNVKKLKHRFAALTGNDFDTFFISEQELQQKMVAQNNQQIGSGSAPANNNNPTPTLGGAIKGKTPLAGASNIMQ